MDPAIARLPTDVRLQLGRLWAERARSELGAGSGFAQTVVGLFAIGAAPELIALASRAGAEEVEHATRCRELAEEYLAEPVVMPRPKRVAMPSHPGSTDALRASLHVVGLCCINETLAAEFVARCLDDSEVDCVRALGSLHLRDEIGHARIGWAHLATGLLDDADRAAVAAFLPRMLTANVGAWRARMTLLPEAGARGHGYPPRAELDEGLRVALDDVFLPGLAEVRIDATDAMRTVRALFA